MRITPKINLVFAVFLLMQFFLVQTSYADDQTEVCNGVDDNNDGSIDEGLNCGCTTKPDITTQFGNAGDVSLLGDWNNDGTDTVGIYRPRFSTFYLSNSNDSNPDASIVATFGINGDVPVVGDWNNDSIDTIGVYRPSTSTFYLSNSNENPNVDLIVTFGVPGDVSVVGDWNNDGLDTIGIYRPSTSTFWLRNSNSAGNADITSTFGVDGDVPVIGDWNNDGTDTVGVYRPRFSTFYLTNSNDSNPNATTIVTFGVNGDMPVVGDLNNDGFDTIGIYRPSTSTFWLRNSNTPGNADLIITFGVPGDVPVIGDWNNDGLDTIGFYRKDTSTFRLKNSNTPGNADIISTFGILGDVPVIGDWNNDSIDTIGVYRPSTSTFYLSNSNENPNADITSTFGILGDVPVIGDWNNDGTDTIGVYRKDTSTFRLRNSNTPGNADIIVTFGFEGDVPVIGDWNNDGTDTVGVYRVSNGPLFKGSSRFFITNSNTPNPQVSLITNFGMFSDVPVIGDWNNDGTDTVGVYRKDTFYLSNTNFGECEPSLNILDKNVNQNSGLNNNLVDLFAYTHDSDNTPEQLTYAIVSQTNQGTVSCVLDSNRFIDCTTQPDKIGESDITVSVSDGTTTETDTFRVNVLEVDGPKPTLTLEKNSACEDHTTSFNLRVIDDEEVSSIKWDFGDGSVKTGTEKEKYVYNKKGTYTLKVSALDSSNNELASLSESIKVNECKNHKIAISSLYIDDSDQIHQGSNIDVYVKVINLGNVKEKVTMEASIDGYYNPAAKSSISISKGDGKWQLIPLKLPDTIPAGNHAIKVTATAKNTKITKYLSFEAKE
ncbi:PKD domain-containing protein [Candidatus Woesearchaeota archaeon]|nr:PKD domain-containing protein [Candidatus Woesearchaeota archaeon]